MTKYKNTIQQRVFEQLVDKKSFTRAELDKAIWVAQGNKFEFNRRLGYYGTNLSVWISTKLVKRIKRGVFKITSRGKLYLTDRGRCNKIIRTERAKIQKRRRALWQERRNQELKRYYDTKEFTYLNGRTIIGVRRLSEHEMSIRGWSKNPLALILDDRTLLIPQVDDEGNDGGAMEHLGNNNTIYTT